jgi:hypothetical protein
MYVGHLALAFGAKRTLPRLSLGWLMAAVTTADLLWPVFLLFGLEHVRIQPGATAFTPLIFDSYPWSHSLLLDVLWGTVLGVLARWYGHSRREALWLAALVVSHWVLDVLSHARDMPLWPGRSPLLGLALWNSIPATLIVEGLLWAVGIGLYLRGRRSKGWRGVLALGTFALLNTFLWVISPWTPCPPIRRPLHGSP